MHDEGFGVVLCFRSGDAWGRYVLIIVSARLIVAASGQYIRLFGKGEQDLGNTFGNIGEMRYCAIGIPKILMYTQNLRRLCSGALRSLRTTKSPSKYTAMLVCT